MSTQVRGFDLNQEWSELSAQAGLIPSHDEITNPEDDVISDEQILLAELMALGSS